MPIRITRPTNPERAWRGRSTVMWSIADALDEFLVAPATRPKLDGAAFSSTVGGWTNEDVIVAVCGTRGIHVVDPALYDAVSLKYETKCRTFEDAFRACARPYTRWGQRDWRDFDIEILRECHSGFRALQMPTWIEELHLNEEMLDYARFKS
jgi:hypothetical protein